MAVIPSRLAGVPAAFNRWMSWREEAANDSRAASAERRAMQRHNAWMQDRNRTSPSELRSRERHGIWMKDRDNELAKNAQATQQRATATTQLEGDIENQMRMLGGKVGDKIPYQVQNPDGTPQHQEMWDQGLNYGDTMMTRPESTIEQNRLLTGQDKLNALKLYNTAMGTNMPSGGSLARLLGAGAGDDPDTPEPFVESMWNASQSKGGIPFDQATRGAYVQRAQDSITGAMESAMAPGPQGMTGVFNEAQTLNTDSVRKTIMQDAWTVARQIARDTKLVDEATAFNQIIEAMSTGKISPLQISQMVGDDAVVGDEGLPGYWTTNQRGLQAAPTSREQLRKKWESQYGNAQTSAQGVGPIIQ
jgi:hypothetical protein